jgi:DNA-binding response OmpR family regulator
MLEKTVDFIKFKADEKGIKLELIINPNVPHSVYGDKDRIKQVLLNIIGNGIKFTSIGEIVIKVSQYPSRIIFSISDTGCGIKPDNISKIFLEYYQEEKYNKNGLGLGLSLSKKLIQMMGGGISVESTFGVGSTFTIDLPLAEERYYLDLSSDDDKELCILIIDPIENNRILLRKFIKQWKINVVAVSSYKEGKKLLDDEEYDIVILNPYFNMDDTLVICNYIQNKWTNTRIVSIGAQKPGIFDANIPDIGNKEQVYNTILSVKKVREHPISVIEFKNYRVCIVEDDNVSAFALKEILIRRGLDEKNIVCIDNGEYAVRNITHNRYNIIFMDCKLKGDMDGITVTRIIKASISHIKIIGMTASITEEEKIVWLSCGLDGMIIKPFSAEAIYNLL